jgi:hypothetical protein
MVATTLDTQPFIRIDAIEHTDQIAAHRPREASCDVNVRKQRITRESIASQNSGATRRLANSTVTGERKRLVRH